MSPKPSRTRPVTAAEVRQFAGKAEEYLSVAQHALAGGLTTAAAGNAIHAAINACDAITGSRIGQRNAAPDHQAAVQLVNGIPDVGREAANALRRVLPMKTRAEYDPAPVSAADAALAVRQAQRLVELMRQVASP